MLLDTKYQQAWVDGDILVYRWLPETAKMTDSEYIEEIQKAADILREQKKPYVLLMAKDLLFVISLTLQHKANDILLPAYNESGVKKLAVVVPHHMIATLSVQQTIEETRVFHKFETRFFSDEQEARNWLLAEQD